MNKFVFKYTQYLLMACFVLGAAAEAAEQAEQQERVPFAQRAMNLTEHAIAVEKQQEENEADKKLDKEVAKLEPVVIGGEEEEEQASEATAAVEQKVKAKGLEAKKIYYTTHAGVYHNPKVVSFFGDTVELEDGSVWYIRAEDRYKALNWFTSDIILVMRNKELFSSFQYKLVNQATGATVGVNLQKAPYYNGPYTYWIVAIDYFWNEIILNDGSVWKMAFSDSHLTSKWIINDTVIIGLNDGGLSSSYPNILINVSTLSHSRGAAVL